MITYAQSIIVIKKFISDLKKYNKTLSFNKNTIVPVGSFRRKSEIVGDIDLLTNIELKNIKFDEIKNISKIISSGDKRISLIYKCKINTKYKKIQIDIFYSSKSCWSYALLHHTGNKLQNIKLRRKANNMGYKLNQYGLFNLIDNAKLKQEMKTEKDIFDFLGKKYKKPEERNV